MARRKSFFSFYFAIAGIVFNLNNVDTGHDLLQRNTSPTKNQRTNGPVNAHLSLLHIPINICEYYGI